jgi:hypothetical protein
MVLRGLRVMLVLAAVLAATGFVADGSHQALAVGRQRTAPDLFYNFYVPPGYYGGVVGAQLYVCPVPTPPLVGHTYVTYQPLMPHEFLYPHARRYVRLHPDGSVTRTWVSWR